VVESNSHVDHEMAIEDFDMPDIDEAEAWALLEAAMFERSAALEREVQDRMDMLLAPGSGTEDVAEAGHVGPTGFAGEGGPLQPPRADGHLGEAPEDKLIDFSSLEEEKDCEEEARQVGLRCRRMSEQR
jgi:hypothetical protein